MTTRLRRDLADAEASRDPTRVDRLRGLLALIARESRARRRPLDDVEVSALLAGELQRFRSLASSEGDQLADLVVHYVPQDRYLEELVSALPERLVADTVVSTIRDLGAGGTDQVEDVVEVVRQRLGPDVDGRAVRHEAERQLEARSSVNDVAAAPADDVIAGRLVSWTPLHAETEPREPPDLYPEHPGLLVEVVDARYVLVDWVERRQVADEAVYEVADLTVIGVEEYRRLAARVVADDRRARLGGSEPGVRLRADLARAEEVGDHGRAAVLRRAVTAVFAEVAREEVDRWRRGPDGDEVLAVVAREAKKLRPLAGGPTDASAVLAEHLPAGTSVDAVTTWLSAEELVAVVAEAVRDAGAEGRTTVERVMATVRPRVSRRAFLHDVLREVERQLSR